MHFSTIVAIAVGIALSACDRTTPPTGEKRSENPGTKASGGNPDPRHAATMGTEEGAFFWFDSKTISSAGHAFYGPFAYARILPYFSPRHQKNDSSWFVLCDGDCLGRSSKDLPFSGPEEEMVLKEVQRIGDSLCYIIAVYGQGSFNCARIDQELRSSKVIGYLGKTSLPRVDREKFVAWTQAVALPIAVRIDGPRFKRISFDWMGDADIRALGFESVLTKEKD